MKRKRLILLAALSLLMTIALSSPNTSNAQPPDPTDEETIQEDVLDPSAPSADQYFAYDDTDAQFNARARVIDEIAHADDNYAGLSVDESTNTVTVYWSGDPPSSVANRARQNDGVTVRIVTDARFDRETVLAASDKLISSTEWSSRLGITMTSTNVDGSGLTVYVEGDEPPAETKTELEAFLELPDGVTFVAESEPVILQAARQSDAAPFSGGSRIRFRISSTSAELCTAGFAVLFGSVGNLATAHHCDTTNARAVQTGAGVQIAPNSRGISRIDSKMVDPTASPATAAYIYTGAYNSSTRASVKNWAANNTGDSVCLSGATSGTRCGVITNDATQIPGLTGSYYIQAQANSGWLSAGGDSGGPWYRTVSGGVQARGIHVGGTTQVTCGTIDPVARNAGATCTRFSLYTPISVVLNNWGARLEVR